MDIPLCSCIHKTKDSQHNHSDTILTCFCSTMCKSRMLNHHKPYVQEQYTMFLHSKGRDLECFLKLSEAC